MVAGRQFEKDVSFTKPVAVPLQGTRSNPVTSEDEGCLPAVGANLRRLRTRRGLSLERLAQRSNVSRAMLSQVELGRSAPTINVLWRVAHALDVTFSALLSKDSEASPIVMREAAAKRLTSRDGAFSSRALFPFDRPRRVEFYERRMQWRKPIPIRLGPARTSWSMLARSPFRSAAPSTISTREMPCFSWPMLHIRTNVGNTDALMYLVMTYAETLG
jgi:transcriptional regulator with XRE-family HTH domain